jgi:hypothetical protein
LTALSVGRSDPRAVPVCATLTVLHEEGGEARDAADGHAEAERPAASPPVHGRPQEHVCGKLDCPGQEEVEELVASQNRSVVRESHVHAGVREPEGHTERSPSSSSSSSSFIQYYRA